MGLLLCAPTIKGKIPFMEVLNLDLTPSCCLEYWADHMVAQQIFKNLIFKNSFLSALEAVRRYENKSLVTLTKLANQHDQNPQSRTCFWSKGSLCLYSGEFIPQWICHSINAPLFSVCSAASFWAGASKQQRCWEIHKKENKSTNKHRNWQVTF